jgi:uncharacterized protein YndB with AHSA1/START domain
MNFVKTSPGAEPVIVEGFFAATPAEVFEAWTDPDIVVKWFGLEPHSLHSVEIDLRPGGMWRFLHSKDAEKSVGFEGQYLEIQPGERLVYSWSYVVDRGNDGREATPESRVEVEFTEKGKGTHVRLVHSAIRTEDGRKGVGGGWEASFGSLEAMLSA